MIFPKHIALIPDGNRTRAKANNQSTQEAYMTSYKRGLELIQYTFTKTDAKVFTLRGLSTENAQKRPKEEFNFLMTMYKIVDEDLDDFLQANNINFKRIWNPDGITSDFKQYLNDKTKRCQCNSDRYFVFAINYGGRDEILRAIQKLDSQGQDFSNITEETLSQNLDLGDLPPIELIIRTKWDKSPRTSGFMSRRIGYAELYFTDTMCPALTTQEYQKALKRFNNIAQFRNYWK